MITGRQWVSVLGSTGSIGVSTLDVIAQHPERFSVFALSAHQNIDLLYQQCLAFKPRYAVISESTLAEQLSARLADASIKTEVLYGAEQLAEIAAAPDVDCVMAAIVGAAGLLPTLAAVKAGKRVLLANKEALVMSGALFMEAVHTHNAELLPIDSEHNAIFQCLPQPDGTQPWTKGRVPAMSKPVTDFGVKKIILTASGGPFRSWSQSKIAAVTPEQACKHPNWSMGQKISVDSATLMNKGLELIEACWLFNVSPDDVQVLIHPQSIVHSMVEYLDGSVLAQMGNPDMRTPIANALSWPERIHSGVPSLDLIQQTGLSFEEPDTVKFPCLELAKQAFFQGGTAMAVLNAANEVAVSAFLREQIRFLDIPSLVADVMSQHTVRAADSLDVILKADQEARVTAQEKISNELELGNIAG